MSKPSIFIFTPFFLPHLGGAEMFVEEITKRLEKAYEFHIIAGRYEKNLKETEHQKNKIIHRVGIGSKKIDKYLYPFWAVVKACTLSKKSMPIVSHGIMASHGGLAALMFSKWKHVPLFITEQSGNLHRDVQKNKMVFWIYKQIYKNASSIHAISNFIKSEIEKNVPSVAHIEVIPNGIDPNTFQIKNKNNMPPHIPPVHLRWGDSRSSTERGRGRNVWETFRREKYISNSIKFLPGHDNKLVAKKYSVLPNGDAQEEYEEAPNIIVVSRLSKEKGVDHIIQSLPAIVKKIPEVKLTLVGDGPERKKLESLTTSLKVQKHVEFKGSVSHEKIPEELAKASIFVCPSNFEGLGIALIEGQASGLPVVGTNVGGIPDVIEHEATGILVPPQNPQALSEAIIRLIKNKKYAQELAQNAQKKLPKFFWNTITEQIHGIYKQYENV